MGIFDKFSPRFWGIVLLFACSLFYLLFQGGKLAFMVFIIVATLCFYLTLGRWSGVSRANGVRTLPAAEHEGVIEAGAPLAVHIQAQIPGFWPIPYVKIKERLVSRDGEEHVFEIFGIPDLNRRVEVSYRTSPLHRGFYRFDDTDCSTEDIFGLFKHKGRLGLPYAFVVLPQRVHIREWKQLHQMFHGVQHHSAKTRFYRETTQINGIREFVNGDRMSRIHWNATAKTGTWKSKEFERESFPKIVLVLDRNMHAYRSKEQFELAVSIAASLVDYAASCDLAVGMLSVGKYSKVFEPKPGASHQKVITSHLIDVEPDGTYPLLNVLKDRARLFTSGIFLVVVSPQFGDAMVPSLAWIEQRQMKPCHMWVASDVPEADREKWNRHLHTTGVLGYAVTSIDKLALALGGHK